MRRIGVVTGSRIEARCLPHRGQFLIRCSAADAARGRAHAATLVDEGVDALLSFGLAGGLEPTLRPGDLLLADRVLAGPDSSPLTLALSPAGGGDALPPQALRRSDGAETLPLEGGGKGGGGGAATIQTSAAWRKALITRLEAGGISYAIGAVVGSEVAITTPAAKHALHASTGALAVDMESHAVGEVAARHGLPFLVLRAVADPADARLPGVALSALSQDGATDFPGLLRGLRARPSEIADLLRLARSSRRGLAALRRVAAMPGPDLGLP